MRLQDQHPKKLLWCSQYSVEVSTPSYGGGVGKEQLDLGMWVLGFRLGLGKMFMIFK